MPDEIISNVRITNLLGLCVFFVLWMVLVKCARLLVMVLKREPLIGWAIGPLGVTLMVLHEPSTLYLWMSVLCPALVSGAVLYIGLFTTLSPITLPEHPLIQALILACGVLLTSVVDLFNALRDIRNPLWGEVRILRSIQFLRATWAKIHFTPFGQSYLNDRFGTNSTDLLQAL